MTNIPLAQNLSAVAPSRIRELSDIAFTMDGVFKLHFGESDMPTPAYIKEAAYKAMNEGYTFYSDNAGLLSLREAVAKKYFELHDVKVDPKSEIVITASGVQALNVSIRCVIDPGDEAIILSPNWPNASSIVSLFSGRPIEIPYKSNRSRFEIDFDALESAVTLKTKLLVYASPSNPLGWVASISDQQSLLDFCRKHRLWLMADEVYERLYFAGPIAPSILRLCSRDDAVIVIQSFSKSYCMTGWRLGWVVARSDLIHKASQLNEFIVSHAPPMIQRAGEIALEKGEKDIEFMKDSIQKRVEFCFKVLSSIESISLPQPEGAFYLFPRIEGVTDSFSFALSLLKETKVSLAPGVAFGNGGEGSVRICCASDLSILEPAMERFARFLQKG
jgi:aspartate/methionine/tyrosine aminotransferase